MAMAGAVQKRRVPVEKPVDGLERAVGERRWGEGRVEIFCRMHTDEVFHVEHSRGAALRVPRGTLRQKKSVIELLVLRKATGSEPISAVARLTRRPGLIVGEEPSRQDGSPPGGVETARNWKLPGSTPADGRELQLRQRHRP